MRMGKSKKSSPQKDPDQYLKIVAKELQKDFDSAEKARRDIQSKNTGKKITPADKNKALDMIYDAWDSNSKKEKIALAEKALELDENCADAYNLLAEYKAKSAVESLEENW